MDAPAAECSEASPQFVLAYMLGFFIVFVTPIIGFQYIPVDSILFWIGITGTLVFGTAGLTVLDHLGPCDTHANYFRHPEARPTSRQESAEKRS